MIDQYGRTIEYLRISVTDRCNLRCVYCMPEEGIEQLPHEQILTFDEIERICRISTKLGISKIKLTGGEPLVRKGLPDHSPNVFHTVQRFQMLSLKVPEAHLLIFPDRLFPSRSASFL